MADKVIFHEYSRADKFILHEDSMIYLNLSTLLYLSLLLYWLQPLVSDIKRMIMGISNLVLKSRVFCLCLLTRHHYPPHPPHPPPPYSMCRMSSEC